MSKSLILLIVLTLATTMMASAEQETAAESAQTETEYVETEFAETDADRNPLMVDGEWLDVPEMNADIYLPAGWTVTQADENGFTAEAGEDAAAESSEETEAPAEETEESAETDGAETAAPAKIVLTKSAFEGADIAAYADENYGEYALADMTGRQAVVVDDAENDARTVAWLHDETTLVTLTLTPASDAELADCLLEIAGSFTVYAAEE